MWSNRSADTPLKLPKTDVDGDDNDDDDVDDDDDDDVILKAMKVLPGDHCRT